MLVDNAVTIVQRLFGDISLSLFASDYLHRLPLALPGTSKHVAALGSWESLSGMLSQADLDLMVVREGTRREANPPSDMAGLGELTSGGWTTLVRHSERHDVRIAELAQAFEGVFRSPVDVHLYLTPPGRFGFSWHYDAEDVFILQTAGEKEYFLRKNTVHPWPLEETLPLDMQYERELMPLSRVRLQAGDMLYIPCGYWHRAEAGGSEAAISLAIGVMSRSGLDVFEYLRGQLVQSLAWRQRLAIGWESDVDERYQALMTTLADDFSRTLKSPVVIKAVREHFACLPAGNAGDGRGIAGEASLMGSERRHDV